MLITDAEIEGLGPLDVRIRGGVVREIGRELARDGREDRLEARGGALLPGLHDHHVHLLALAAAGSSVRCGPPEVTDEAALRAALAAAPGGPAQWIRGIGYHESVAGELDRARLDALVPERPLRIQHRSGAAWLVNSAALARLGLDVRAGSSDVVPPDEELAGVERDARGRPTGRLFRLDAWLRARLSAESAPDLRAVSERLARFGVTGVTDATATTGERELALFARAIVSGELGQRLVAMAGPDRPDAWPAGVERGPAKILLDERHLPGFDELCALIRHHRAYDRAVAIHCVTRAEAVLAIGALEAAGCRSGDRLEHASVAPPDVVAWVARLPLAVVTQPSFVYERGDAYRSDVDSADLPWLYRLRGFLAAGIALGAGTDAPFGGPDPWLAIRAAMDRRTREGFALGPDEALAPEEALARFTTPPDAPGGAPRRIAVGAPADLCLLDRPWREVRCDPSSDRVMATLRAGRPLWLSGDARLEHG
jgi:predicted amidohydrolase YtcJ